MLIYYPLNSHKLVELEQRLDTLDLRTIFNSKEEDIELYLPKFTIQNEQRLKLTLTEVGSRLKFVYLIGIYIFLTIIQRKSFSI